MNFRGLRSTDVRAERAEKRQAQRGSRGRGRRGLKAFLTAAVATLAAAATFGTMTFLMPDGGIQNDVKADGEITIRVNFLSSSEEGGAWAIKANTRLGDLIRLRNTDEQYSVTAVYSNGFTYHMDFVTGAVRDLLNPQGYADIGLSPAAGSTYVDITITDYDEDIDILTPNSEFFSAISVDGEDIDVPSFAEVRAYGAAECGVGTVAKSLQSTPGASYTVNVTNAETLGGTVSFSSPGDIIPEGYEYNYRWSFNQSNYNEIEKMYWTSSADGNATKHYGVPDVGSTNTIFDFHVPMGGDITIHNIPGTTTVTRFSPAGGASDIDTNYYGGTTIVTEGGEDIDAAGHPELARKLVYKITTGDQDIEAGQTYVLESGWISAWNLGDGFNVDVQMSRNYVEFPLYKIYPETEDYMENCEHLFRVTLYDTLLDEPYAGKNVAVLHAWEADTALSEAIEEMKTTDENGVLEVSVYAGEYIVFGKGVPAGYAEEAGLQSGEHNTFNQFAQDGEIESLCFTEIGMLPQGISYKIEEVSDFYTPTINGDDEGVVDYPADGAAPDIWQLFPAGNGTVGNVINTFQNVTGLTMPLFANRRNLTSLTIAKEVVGEDTDKEFKFTITLTSRVLILDPFATVDGEGKDGRIQFAESGWTVIDDMEYQQSTAEVTLKSGESLTINGLPAGVQYTVEEDFFSSRGYDVTYVNGQGEETGEGVLSSDGDTVTVYNAVPGSIQIDKLQSDISDDIPADQEFEFIITFDKDIPMAANDPDVGGGTVNFAERAFTTRLKVGQSARVTGLPNGVNYTITETPIDGYEAIDPIEGTIDSSSAKTRDIVVPVENVIPKYGSLTVEKAQAEGSDEIPSDKTFDFVVTFDADLQNAAIDPELVGGKINFEEGTWTFSLKVGQKTRITGLPHNAFYSITEAAVENYDEIDPIEGTIDVRDEKTQYVVVKVENTYTIPTPEPTDEPTDSPTPEPTDKPTDEPTPEPTDKPTDAPTPGPTDEPTDAPTPGPTDEPTDAPTEAPTPTDKPTDTPTGTPSTTPTDSPTPTGTPVDTPSSSPTPTATGGDVTATATPTPTGSSSSSTSVVSTGEDSSANGYVAFVLFVMAAGVYGLRKRKAEEQGR